MVKALKPLIIVLLVFSLAALVLGILLFGQREALKGRTQKLERAATDVAKTLASAKEPFIEAKEPKQLDQNALMSYENMDSPLKQLMTLASIRYEELNNTYTDLDIRTKELDATKQELTETQAALKQTQDKVTELEGVLAQKENELTQARSQIDTLEQEKSSLQVQVADLNNQLVKAEENIRDLQDQVTSSDNYIKELEIRLGGGGTGKMKPGLNGKIMAVNTDWNFVVLNIGTDEELVPGAEMLIHRGDVLVGKIKISSVKKNLSIAEIVQDWKKMPIEEGDYVLY